MLPSSKNRAFLKIADNVFLITSKDTHIVRLVKKGFSGFIAQGGNSAVKINVIVREDIKGNPYACGRPHKLNIMTLDGFTKVSGNSFNGWFDHKMKNAEVLIPSSVSAFYLFLRFLMIMVLSSRKGIIVHACSIAHKGQGYVFSGSPNTGKSTMALISSGKKILSDDFSIIRKVGRQFRVFPSPFWGNITPNGKDENDSYPIKGIYFLNHSDENFIRPFKSWQRKMVMLHKHTLMFPSLRKHCNNIFAIEYDVMSKIMLFKLFFVPNSSVWRCIYDE